MSVPFPVSFEGGRTAAAVPVDQRSDLSAALAALGVVMVDGGTDAGVMHLIGRARTRTEAMFPLVGVPAVGTVRFPGKRFGVRRRWPLDAHHSRSRALLAYDDAATPGSERRRGPKPDGSQPGSVA